MATIKMMCNKNNPYSLYWICPCVGVTLVAVGIIAAVYFAIIGLGIGAWSAAFVGKYDMYNGTSLTYGDKSTLMCYIDYGGHLFGACIPAGLFVIVVGGFFFLVIFAICMGLYNTMTHHNISIKEIHMGWIVCFVIALISVLYPVVCGFGILGSTILNFDNYNMTTGWPMSGEYKHGRLMCYNDRGQSLFVGCILHGIVTMILAGVCSVFAGAFTVYPLFLCCKYVYQSYTYASDVVSVDETTMIVQDV